MEVEKEDVCDYDYFVRIKTWAKRPMQSRVFREYLVVGVAGSILRAYLSNSATARVCVDMTTSAVMTWEGFLLVSTSA